jgi:TatD DNase family protein
MSFSPFDFINFHTHQNHGSGLEILNFDNRNWDVVKGRLYSIGIHPWYINKTQVEEQLNEIKEHLNNDDCVAIGEIGLDKLIDIDYELQKQIFEAQLKIANTYRKSVIIHSVKTHHDIISIKNKVNPNLNLAFHGFNNNYKIAEFLIKNNSWFSFGPTLLNEKSNAYSVIKKLDVEKIFLETDDRDVEIEQIYYQASKLLKLNISHLCEIIQCNIGKFLMK